MVDDGPRLCRANIVSRRCSSLHPGSGDAQRMHTTLVVNWTCHLFEQGEAAALASL
jgi:hypothetical protein